MLTDSVKSSVHLRPKMKLPVTLMRNSKVTGWKHSIDPFCLAGSLRDCKALFECGSWYQPCQQSACSLYCIAWSVIEWKHIIDSCCHQRPFRNCRCIGDCRSWCINKVLLPCSVLTHEAQDGNTVSILSAVNGHSEIVDELMTVGADVNHVKKVCLFGIVSPKESQNGNKTFILDAYQGLIEVVKFLLESGVEVSRVYKVHIE